MSPTAKQRKAKARFFAAIANNPLVEATRLPHHEVARLSGNQQCAEWLQDPEFTDWFFNRDEAKHLLEAGVESSIKRLIQIVECEDVGPKGQVRAADQVTAAAKLLEFAGYSPPKMRVVEYKDKQIADMSEEELRAFISKSAPKLIKGGSDA